MIYLYNFYDHMELPEAEVYTKLGEGINISYGKLTSEVVARCHEKGKKVGVWIDSTIVQEKSEIYWELLDMKVDFFCTDYPLTAMEVRSQWHERNSTQLSSVSTQATTSSSDLETIPGWSPLLCELVLSHQNMIEDTEIYD